MTKHFAMASMMIVTGLAQAYDFDVGGIPVTVNGFGELTAAKVLSGDNVQYQQYHCPCAIENWEYIGLYQQNQGWQTKPESLGALQAKAKFTKDFSATVQAVSRSVNKDNRPTIDWAFLSYDLNPSWTVQAGRKRIPLYYYSDYLYIGYAYPWVRPAPDVYGWPIYEYDGANVDYHTDIGNSDWTLEANYWGGHYSQSNDAYDTLLYTNAPTGPAGATQDEQWTQMRGAYINLTNGVFGTRLMYELHRDNIQQHNPDGTSMVVDDDVLTRIYGGAFNVDYGPYIVRTEADRFEQITLKFIYNYYLAGVGYHYHDWTGMVTFSHYITEPTPNAPVEGRKTRYLSLRWDFYKNLALKFQYDVSHDESQKPFLGDHTLASVSLQGAF